MSQCVPPLRQIVIGVGVGIYRECRTVLEADVGDQKEGAHETIARGHHRAIRNDGVVAYDSREVRMFLEPSNSRMMSSQKGV